MCRPSVVDNTSIQEQVRMRMFSAMPVASGVTGWKHHQEWRSVMQEDFELGQVGRRLPATARWPDYREPTGGGIRHRRPRLGFRVARGHQHVVSDMSVRRK
jgi:hypothetical protein